MKTYNEMQPEDIHGPRTTEPFVMQSVDRAVEIIRNALLEDFQLCAGQFFKKQSPAI